MNISCEIKKALIDYRDLLIKWNSNINLVSEKTIRDVWERHIIDCLQLMQFIDMTNVHLVDIGSGAGLPGIILSIAGISHVTLIESNAKKCAFLLQAAQISNNKVTVINQRVENVHLVCDILVCRAFASINQVFNYVVNISVKKKYLFLKGEDHIKELEVAQKKRFFDYFIHDSITSSSGKVIEIIPYV